MPVLRVHKSANVADEIRKLERSGHVVHFVRTVDDQVEIVHTEPEIEIRDGAA